MGDGVIVFCKLEEPWVRVVIDCDFEGFCLVGRFLKLFDIIGNLCITGSAGLEGLLVNMLQKIYT